MQIALIGYGKMGRLVEQAAVSAGHGICLKLHASNWKPQELELADMCIDFSHPNSVLENVKRASQIGKSIVMGTTGWAEHLDEVKACVADSGIGLMYSPNFSIGIALFMRLIEEAAQLFDPFDSYAIGATESHHALKVDSPSGTAKEIITRLSSKMRNKYPPEFSSIRCGHIPGTHTIFFDSPEDTITLTHQARNREGFAKGAVSAAEWLQGKSGFFTMNDLLL